MLKSNNKLMSEYFNVVEAIELCLEVEKEEFKPLELIGVQRIAINK